ncbi:MAG: hypothetical protein HND44_14510 [Chloroflexi bacterium]|nr:hypothetical protein [Ardenticatenaceae bacterium]MBL1129676.1 hypothetical protein [Chloroflexota bacterium]NOG35756.1 hypothetical protein [Chloroflexota bacterium]GIK58837.1 MAG: hypothetical protein BroJett015_45000 [Chloroflexota bacterium]
MAQGSLSVAFVAAGERYKGETARVQSGYDKGPCLYAVSPKPAQTGETGGDKEDCYNQGAGPPVPPLRLILNLELLPCSNICGHMERSVLAQ